MPNLTDEIAQLNINATALLLKHDGAFTALGLAGEQIRVQLEALIQEAEATLDASIALSQAEALLMKQQLESVISSAETLLEGSVVVSATTIVGNNIVVNGYSTDFTCSANSYLDENVQIASFEVDWGDGSTIQNVVASNSSTIASHVFVDGAIDTAYTLKVRAIDSLGNKGSGATKVVTIASNHAPTPPTVTTVDEVYKQASFTVTLSGSTDADGDAITYSLSSSDFIFSKVTGIVANEVITMTAPNVQDDTTCTFTAKAVDAKGMNSTSVVSTVVVKSSSMGGAFGRIWNITDDVYRRAGLNPALFSNATGAEFNNWLSPTATRVNDNDTSTACDLTQELDTNPALPYSTIARKVVTNTGAVSAFNHSTVPTATQQIMSEIQKTQYIHAIIVANAKEYDVQFVSLEPFTIDVLNDLGLTNVTSITCFNPTSGISSGTVVGNVISSALHPAFAWHDGSGATFTYIGSFPSVTGRSTFNEKATHTITLPTARTQHKAFGANFNQHDFWNNSLLQLLAYIERGSNYFEGSGTKWDGFAWSGAAQADVQNNGLTLSLQNKTGIIKNGSNKIIANSYRGIENYHSNLYMWVDGININNGLVHLAKAGSAYASDTASAPYFSSGYTATATGSWIDINKWQAGTFIPNATGGGTSTTKVTDKAIGSTGWRVLSVSGTLYFPDYSGLSFWYGPYDSSNSSWSIVSRASFRKFVNQP